MKRDLELIKRMLLEFEHDFNDYVMTGDLIKKLNLLEQESVFVHHLDMIYDDLLIIPLHSNGLGIQRGLNPTNIVICSIPIRLISKGHDFLEVCKNDTVFNKVKSFTLPIAITTGTELLKQLAMKAVGL